MATSKNNRKKGRKRQPMHSKPVPEYVIKAQQEQKEEELKSLQRTNTISLLGIIIMIGGFVLVVLNYMLIGYPITFIGSLLCMLTVQPDVKHRKLVIGGHMVYCLLVLFLWVGLLIA